MRKISETSRITDNSWDRRRKVCSGQWNLSSFPELCRNWALLFIVGIQQDIRHHLQGNWPWSQDCPDQSWLIQVVPE
jgi:hypothetical protein